LSLGLGVGISFYNDAQGLERCLSSLQVPEIETILAIDGRYHGYRSDSDLSNDGSRQVVNKYPNTLLVDFPATQIRKRNKYLELSKRYGLDFLLILDSDEYILPGANWPLFKHACEESVRLDKGQYRIYDVRYQNEMDWDLGERPRLWYKPWQIRYDVKHYRWIIRAKCKDRIVYEGNCGRRLFPAITIKHHRAIRPPDRNKTMDAYEDRLMHLEIKQMRKKYNLP
jgi:glycosyltransferase involved in cell wall biosynthesis